jgi:hypothetical protein
LVTIIEIVLENPEKIMIFLKKCLSKIRKELGLRCKRDHHGINHFVFMTLGNCVKVILLGSHTNKHDQTSTATNQDTTNDSIKVKESHT